MDIDLMADIVPAWSQLTLFVAASVVLAGRYITGLIYIGLGALTAFSSPRSAR